MNLEEMNETKKVITIAGSPVEVSKDDNVKTTLTRILRDKGIDSFTILVDGEEVTSTDSLPEKFDGHEVVVERYVKAG